MNSFNILSHPGVFLLYEEEFEKSEEKLLNQPCPSLFHVSQKNTLNKNILIHTQE